MRTDSRQLRLFGDVFLEQAAEQLRQEDGLSAAAIESRRTTTRPYKYPNLLEQIVDKENIAYAIKRVRTNRGAAGIDKMKVSELEAYFQECGGELISSILDGTYKPKAVRRVEIPKKEKGKVRLLGIPTAVDRVIQQAITQGLSPIFEPLFSEYSYGFRPNRSAHDALRQLMSVANAGYVWVVDMDLEMFFDTVAHSKLMRLVSNTIDDPRTISLIHKYLNAGVMVGDIFEESKVGVPQGGPLSPLLANIMLTELDRELERREHQFVRYADDCMILCKSYKAAIRTMNTITDFIERKLHLKVNREKTKVARIDDYKAELKFLGYGFYSYKGQVHPKVHKKSQKAMKEKLKELTWRSQANTLEDIIAMINAFVRGWTNYYKLANAKSFLSTIDSWLRRRMRMLIWKRWKRVRTRFRELMKLELTFRVAIETANTRKSYWRAAATPGVHKALGNKYLKEQGLMSFSEYYEFIGIAL